MSKTMLYTKEELSKTEFSYFAKAKTDILEKKEKMEEEDFKMLQEEKEEYKEFIHG